MLLKSKYYIVIFSIFFSNQILSEETVTRSERLKEALFSLGGNTVGKALPGTVINNPYRYISGKPGKYVYQLLQEDNKKSETKFEWHSKFDDKIDGTKLWSLKVDNDFIEEWKADSFGNVHLMAQTDIDSGYRVTLMPHLVLPTGARQGQQWNSESNLKVYEISDPDFVAYEGTLLSKKRYEGRFEITTPAGRFNAILISDNYEINIGAVNIQDQRYTFYALDVGKIAEIDGSHVSAFLFIHKRKNESKVLTHLPQTIDK